jgi:hypothetical protein
VTRTAAANSRSCKPIHKPTASAAARSRILMCKSGLTVIVAPAIRRTSVCHARIRMAYQKAVLSTRTRGQEEPDKTRLTLRDLRALPTLAAAWKILLRRCSGEAGSGNSPAKVSRNFPCLSMRQLGLDFAFSRLTPSMSLAASRGLGHCVTSASCKTWPSAVNSFKPSRRVTVGAMSTFSTSCR